jgi:hypothetical protein
MENKENNNNNNTLIDVIMRQTDYTEEVAAEKLIQHKQNVLSVIREYMSSSISNTNTNTNTNTSDNAEQQTTHKSTSQLIYGEIRNMMGNACANYRRKKEMEEYRKAQIQLYLQQQQQKQQQQQQQQPQSLENIPE